MSLINKISYFLPPSLINTKALLFANKGFRARYNLLKESESWTLGDVVDWQEREVKQLLNSTYSDAEALSRLWNNNDFHPGDFSSLKDIVNIPTTDKQFVKAAADSILNAKFPKNKLTYRYTGGSTGSPMKFALEQRQIYEEKAYFYYIWEKYGYRIGDKCVMLKGDKLANANGRCLHKVDGIFNYLKLDSDYLVSEGHIDTYDQAIRKFGANFLFGFPSSIYLLASLYVRTGRKPPVFDTIFLASENTYPDQIDFIKNVFSAKDVFYHYGHSEYATLAFKYRENDQLGFVPFYGIAELLDEKGKVITESGKLGEVTVTGFSHAQPFIRYKTNDYAVSSDFISTDYMKNYSSVERIEGRMQEFIVTKDKRLVSICTMGAAHFDDMNSLVDTQYEQSEEGRIIFSVVTSDHKELSNNLVKLLKGRIEDKLEGTVDVEIKQVDGINRTGLGKKSMIRQSLNIKEYME